MIYYDESKRKWVDEQEPSGWHECLIGVVLYVTTMFVLFWDVLK